MSVLTAGTTDKPVIRTFCLTGNSDVTSRLSFQIAAVVPIHSHIFDELESIHETLIILRKVGSHL